MHRVFPISTDEWVGNEMPFDEKTGRAWSQQAQIGAVARATREYVLKQFRASYVKDEFNLTNLIQSKAGFSFDIAVMDRSGGWTKEIYEQENWVGARFAANMWIFSNNRCVQRTKTHANIQHSESIC